MRYVTKDERKSPQIIAATFANRATSAATAADSSIDRLSFSGTTGDSPKPGKWPSALCGPCMTRFGGRPGSSLQTRYASEAMSMSDQDDWEFASPDDAKTEIRAAVEYLLRDATGGARGDIVQEIIAIVRQVASGLPPEQPNPLDDGLPGG
jgi:hypothetical protein